MAGFLSNLFKLQDKVDFSALLQNGAVLLDVRTREEFRGGHANGSVNIPLDTLVANLSRLSPDKPIIAVCQSGVRSRNAIALLKKNGYHEVYNGGCWFHFK